MPAAASHALIFNVLAILLFCFYFFNAREREAARRCVMCGTRAGEKHHADCPWKDER